MKIEKRVQKYYILQKGADRDLIPYLEGMRQRVSWLTGMTLIFEIVVGFGDKLAFILIFTL